MAVKQWPLVRDRNVAQPSRVRLTPATGTDGDVYDVTPVPGTIKADGTYLNKALFDGEKAYVDQNDIPFSRTTSSDGVNYVATIPAWSGMTVSELDGKIFVLEIDKQSTNSICTLNINNTGAKRLYLMGGSSSSAVSPFPTSEYLISERNIVVKYSNKVGYYYILGGYGYASPTEAGLVKIDGTSITINAEGVLSATGGGSGGYTLPPATSTILGGVKVGSGLSVTTDGTLSAKINTTDLDNLAVTSAKIADSAITSAKIADGTIATSDVANLAITGAKIANATISRTKLDAALEQDIADLEVAWDSVSPTVAAGSVVNTDWAINRFTLEKMGSMVVCTVDLSYHTQMAFSGTYAFVPVGYRPKVPTGYLPAMMSTGSALHSGSVIVGTDGSMYINSAGVTVNQVIANITWTV